MVNQEDKKEKIIFAAMILFTKKGFAKTSMADIAKEAGIGKGTTYEYFKGKDQLFFATFEWFVKYSEEAAKISLADLGLKSATEKIKAFSQSVLNSLKESEEFYPLVLEFWAATASSKYSDRMKSIFKDLYKKIGDVLIAIITEGIANEEFHSQIDVHTVVPGIVGAWDAIGLQAWFYNGTSDEAGDEFDMEKTMNSFTDLIIKGFLKTSKEDI
ncbi:MAG: TetR/AcrR family transcriptional regulator [Desulfobacteraceae bacterium]|nr:TetR/AcrR family transcriptional regulator [Desulfobacteraceae bacterium]